MSETPLQIQGIPVHESPMVPLTRQGLCDCEDTDDNHSDACGIHTVEHISHMVFEGRIYMHPDRLAELEENSK